MTKRLWLNALDTDSNNLKVLSDSAIIIEGILQVDLWLFVWLAFFWKSIHKWWNGADLKLPLWAMGRKKGHNSGKMKINKNKKSVFDESLGEYYCRTGIFRTHFPPYFFRTWRFRTVLFSRFPFYLLFIITFHFRDFKKNAKIEWVRKKTHSTVCVNFKSLA